MLKHAIGLERKLQLVLAWRRKGLKPRMQAVRVLTFWDSPWGRGLSLSAAIAIP